MERCLALLHASGSTVGLALLLLLGQTNVPRSPRCPTSPQLVSLVHSPCYGPAIQSLAFDKRGALHQCMAVDLWLLQFVGIVLPLALLRRQEWHARRAYARHLRALPPSLRAAEAPSPAAAAAERDEQCLAGHDAPLWLCLYLSSCLAWLLSSIALLVWQTACQTAH